MDSFEFQLQGIVTQPIRSSTKKRPLHSPKIGSSPSLLYSKNRAQNDYHHEDDTTIEGTIGKSSPMMEPLRASNSGQDITSSNELSSRDKMTPRGIRNNDIPESPPHSTGERNIVELQNLTSRHSYVLVNDIQSPSIERLQHLSKLNDGPKLTSPSLLAERLIIPSSTEMNVPEDFEQEKKLRPIKALSGGWADKLQKSLIRHRANRNFKKLDPSAQELPADWECIVLHVMVMDEGLLKCICLLREEDCLVPSRWFILLSSIDHFKGTLPSSSPFKITISDPWLKTQGEPYWIFAPHITLSVMTAPQSLHIPPATQLNSFLSPCISRR